MDPELREAGLNAFYSGRFAASVGALQAAAQEGDAEAAFHWGAALERLNRLGEADAALTLAADLGYDYDPPCRIDEEGFDREVHAALDELPERIREVLEASCTVLREDYPPAPRVIHEGVDPLLLGECIGSLESTRLGYDGPVRVIVYRRNLEKVCGDLEQLREEIWRTVLHEVGHAMGMDEAEVEALGLG